MLTKLVAVVVVYFSCGGVFQLLWCISVVVVYFSCGGVFQLWWCISKRQLEQFAAENIQ